MASCRSCSGSLRLGSPYVTLPDINVTEGSYWECNDAGYHSSFERSHMLTACADCFGRHIEILLGKRGACNDVDAKLNKPLIAHQKTGKAKMKHELRQ